MFVDRVTIHCRGGDGGNGCVAFRREFKVAKGGPYGGDGGHGGSVVIAAERNVDSLVALVGQKHWRAKSGENGLGSLCHGKTAEDTVIQVPVGTLVYDTDGDRLMRDLAQEGDRVVVAPGGRGGRGNTFFKSSTNRAPRQFEPGGAGIERIIRLELKLIADVGIVGKPNAGKSTLLSRVSRARPEIADYPFTTRHPNLGLVQVGLNHQFVMADIPGLIEGAHAGVGLGHEFLRHVERTKVLVHLVEPAPVDGSDPIENYLQIRNELKLYDPILCERPEVVAITKAELPESQAIAQKLEEKLGKPVILFSSVTGQGLPQLLNAIFQRLETSPPTAHLEKS